MKVNISGFLKSYINQNKFVAEDELNKLSTSSKSKSKTMTRTSPRYLLVNLVFKYKEKLAISPPIINIFKKCKI